MAQSQQNVSRTAPSSDEAQLAALGYEQKFDRKMNIWANFALGFLYLSPLVGVFALFALGLTTAGPASIWWIAVVAVGQLLVALVFGEIVSQYPVAGGVYVWARRLWNGQYAWMVAWLYVLGLIIGITSTALFSTTFVASLFGIEATPVMGFVIATAVALVALALNYFGTKTLSLIAQAGLAAELTGVVALGLYLLLFQRQQPFSVFFDTMGAGGGAPAFGVFLGASLVGLYLFYGFEACADVAEEVQNPSRRIPRSMAMTVIIGGASAFLSFAGYVLAAPNLPAIVSGEIADPVTAILQSSLGVVGSKIFLIVALTSFLAGVMSQQTAASRLLYAFSRDNMLPGSRWLSRVSSRHVPLNALIAANVIPLLLFVFVYFSPDSLPRIAAGQMLIGYLAFQMVVLAALRMRVRGWRPAGVWSLGRLGPIVNVAALAYGVLGMIILASPGAGDLPFYDRWISLIGLVVAVGVGLVYLLVARPQNDAAGPEGDAMDVAARIRGIQAERQEDQDESQESRSADLQQRR